MIEEQLASPFNVASVGVVAAQCRFVRSAETDQVGRDDAVAMSYLVKNWTFDPKRPCMVR